MKRDLKAMSAQTHDLVVVGGGITGACIARDAALRGLDVALVEKRDFASATTAASSKLIHGGLRYLQNLEIGLVRESLRERRIWSNVAPHLVDRLAFLMPSNDRRIRGRLKMALGMRAYDWLAYDRNRLDDPEKSVPAHKKLSREEVLELEPSLRSDDLTGAMLFYDYQMYSPERLALECLLSACEAGAQAANYAEVESFLREGDRVTGVRVRDRIAPETEGGPEQYDILGRVVVNAAGPWADLLMGALRPVEEGQIQPGRRLIRSKGIHLLTRALTNGHAIAVTGEASHFFILPWRGYSLLGTTDTIYKGDPDEVHVTEKDIIDFLAVVNKGYPGARLLRSDVVHFYAGLRPIVETEGTKDVAERGADDPDTYTASRAAEAYDHEPGEGLKGIITAIGGKWTTSRGLAEEVVDMVVKKLGDPAKPCITDETPTHGGGVGRFSEFTKQVIAKYNDLPAAVVENLARNYGSRMEEVLALAKANPHLTERLSDKFPDIAAQVVHAVRQEMAMSVEDILFRRTGLGTLGSPGERTVDRVADIMAQELGWTGAQRAVQIEHAAAKFTSWARTMAIVNPHSWGDRTGAVWPEIEAKLRHAIGPVKAVFTDSPMAAQRLTTQALKDGMEQIIAVGGDGTVNEVINGFFDQGKAINPEAVVAVLTSGTGRDFGRTFGMPQEVEAQIERLAVSEIRAIDLGRLSYIDDTGQKCVRLFDNIASFGLSGATDRAVNSLTYAKRFGGKFAFQWGMFKALLGYRNKRVRIQVDDIFDQVVTVSTTAVCNGQYFGGSMHIAPNAEPDDGLFDVIIVADLGLVELLWKSGKIYRGEHLSEAKVTVLRGRRVIATPVDADDNVMLDVDGETPGRLPATFEIMPQAINLRC